MFWKKKDKNGPTPLSALLSKEIAKESEKMPPQSDHWVKYMSVQRRHEDDEDTFDVRIYDETAINKMHINVSNFSSLDGHTDVILFEGWYNKKTKKADIKYKKAA